MISWRFCNPTPCKVFQWALVGALILKVPGAMAFWGQVSFETWSLDEGQTWHWGAGWSQTGVEIPSRVPGVFLTGGYQIHQVWSQRQSLGMMTYSFQMSRVGVWGQLNWEITRHRYSRWVSFYQSQLAVAQVRTQHKDPALTVMSSWQGGWVQKVGFWYERRPWGWGLSLQVFQTPLLHPLGWAWGLSLEMFWNTGAWPEFSPRP